MDKERYAKGPGRATHHDYYPDIETVTRLGCTDSVLQKACPEQMCLQNDSTLGTHEVSNNRTAGLKARWYLPPHFCSFRYSSWAIPRCDLGLHMSERPGYAKRPGSNPNFSDVTVVNESHSGPLRGIPLGGSPTDYAYGYVTKDSNHDCFLENTHRTEFFFLQPAVGQRKVQQNSHESYNSTYRRCRNDNTRIHCFSLSCCRWPIILRIQQGVKRPYSNCMCRI